MSASREIPGVDTRTASPARVYDVLLGGKDNFAVDRELAENLIAHSPIVAWIAQENRAFLRRTVQYCAEQGVRQFIDLGSGLPTQNNVHEVVQRVDESCRVVYVDNDPVAVVHATALLAGGVNTAAIAGDLRRPNEIISDEEVRRLIDFSKPVAVVMAAILHFIPDSDDPFGAVAEFVDAMAPGSYLVLSHGCHDGRLDSAARVRNMYQRSSASLATRSQEEIAAFFTGLELVDPGMVLITQWHPHLESPRASQASVYGGVARKP